jgi:hypothetical protein
MNGARLAAVLSQYLKRPVEGLVLRRAVGRRLMAYRARLEEPIDLETYSEVIALVPFTRGEVLSAMQKGHERVPQQSKKVEGISV